MEESMQKAAKKETVVSISLPSQDEQLEQAMHEFLLWLEHTKGLKLCNPFKPQYDWYMPSFISKQKLAREYLNAMQPAGLVKPKLDRMS
jgi:hypothetical protein